MENRTRRIVGADSKSSPEYGGGFDYLFFWQLYGKRRSLSFF